MKIAEEGIGVITVFQEAWLKWEEEQGEQWVKVGEEITLHKPKTGPVDEFDFSISLLGAYDLKTCGLIWQSPYKVCIKRYD